MEDDKYNDKVVIRSARRLSRAHWTQKCNYYSFHSTDNIEYSCIIIEL